MMHSPNCGTRASAEQKYCRSCGLGLQAVSQIVAAHAAASGPNPAREEQVEIDKYQYVRMWKRMWGWGFAVLFAGLFLSIVGKKIIHDEIVTAVGAIIAITSLWPLVYPFFSIFQVKEGAVRQAPQPAALPEPLATTDPLPEHHSALALSVAERTTDLLEVGRPDGRRERPLE
jgi:hypothetical protein